MKKAKVGDFLAITEDPYERVRQWKKQSGKKVIGCFPMYVPEEIIHAADMLPITLLATEQNISLADKHLRPTLCNLARSNTELACKGELDLLDGVIIPDICETLRGIYDTWELNEFIPFTHSLVLPHGSDSLAAREWLVKELSGLRSHLEELCAHPISDEELRKSIAIYNENRRLLNRLYELRRANPSVLRASDVTTIVQASMFMPKEKHSRALAQFLEGIQLVEGVSDGKTRIVVSGRLCCSPKKSILDLLEESGALIVDDDLYVGSRYIAVHADEDGAPLEALAKRYTKGVPCVTRYDSGNDYGDYLVNMVKGNHAQGAVILTLGYCDIHAWDWPYLHGKLEGAGIPSILIETENGVMWGQIRTRLQAFLEIVASR